MSLNIAHRGGANLWPENTLAAFERAIAGGADGIELDLQLTCDGVLAVHHDARLKPDATRARGAWLTKPTPKIADLTFADLASFDVGRLDPASAYAQTRAGRADIDGCAIPDFAALCALIVATAPSDFRLYVELKTEMTADAAPAKAIADAFLHCLEADRAARALRDRMTLISFDWRSLAHARARSPELDCAFTTLGFAETDPDRATAGEDARRAAIRARSASGAPWFGPFDWRAAPGDTHAARVLHAIANAAAQFGGGNGTGKTGWFADHADLTPETMALAERLGLSVSAWTVNDPTRRATLKEMGCTAIVTDRPDLFVNAD